MAGELISQDLVVSNISRLLSVFSVSILTSLMNHTICLTPSVLLLVALGFGLTSIDVYCAVDHGRCIQVSQADPFLMGSYSAAVYSH